MMAAMLNGAAPALQLYSRNGRTHSKKQVQQVAKSIQPSGFCNPVLIEDEKPR